MSKEPVSVEDAFNITARYLKEDPGGCSDAGYDVFLPQIIAKFLQSQEDWNHGGDNQPRIKSASPPFYAGAWELCRRGILRPGVKGYMERAVPEGNAGCGFSLTPTGREWLERAATYDLVPAEPGRFSGVLDKFSLRFGEGYRERSQEAIRCYEALAYLACCSMCGAAAESVFLAVAIEKDGDEDKVLGEYATKGGRGRIEKRIIGHHPPHIQNDLKVYSSLLKYWRDEASHGQKSSINEGEAFTSLVMLLRFAMFVENSWNALTGTS